MEPFSFKTEAMDGPPWFICVFFGFVVLAMLLILCLAFIRACRSCCGIEPKNRNINARGQYIRNINQSNVNRHNRNQRNMNQTSRNQRDRNQRNTYPRDDAESGTAFGHTMTSPPPYDSIFGVNNSNFMYDNGEVYHSGGHHSGGHHGGDHHNGGCHSGSGVTGGGDSGAGDASGGACDSGGGGDSSGACDSGGGTSGGGGGGID